MNSRERVHAALRRDPADRVPVSMWFHPSTRQRLARELEIDEAHVPTALGDDICQTWVNNNVSMEGVRLQRDGDCYTDPWGIEWRREGSFNQILRAPLEHADAATVRAYRYPYEQVDVLLARMKPVVANPDNAFIGMDVSPCGFEMVNRIRGMAPALMDMAADPELAETMVAAAADFAVHLAEKGVARFCPDWLWTGDDVGAQQAMMMSPATWRQIVKPHLRRVVAAGRKNGVWVAFHSCGAIRPIIPDLIEIGVDVLNPLQGACPGMEPLELKAEFGRDLAFMGGVDTQSALPRHSAGEVYAETRRLIEGMRIDGGGYILAASHTVPPETPTENIFALYKAAGIEEKEVFDRAATIRKLATEGC